MSSSPLSVDSLDLVTSLILGVDTDEHKRTPNSHWLCPHCSLALNHHRVAYLHLTNSRNTHTQKDALCEKSEQETNA